MQSRVRSRTSEAAESSATRGAGDSGGTNHGVTRRHSSQKGPVSTTRSRTTGMPASGANSTVSLSAGRPRGRRACSCRRRVRRTSRTWQLDRSTKCKRRVVVLLHGAQEVEHGDRIGRQDIERFSRTLLATADLDVERSRGDRGGIRPRCKCDSHPAVGYRSSTLLLANSYDWRDQPSAGGLCAAWQLEDGVDLNRDSQRRLHRGAGRSGLREEFCVDLVHRSEVLDLAEVDADPDRVTQRAAPAASATVARLRSVWRTCSAKPWGCSPYSGSNGPCPETNARSPERTACQVGPCLCRSVHHVGIRRLGHSVTSFVAVNRKRHGSVLRRSAIRGARRRRARSTRRAVQIAFARAG